MVMHHDVNGRIKAGAVEIELHCNTAQLDEALAKTERLIQRLEHAKSLGAEFPTALVTAALVTTAATGMASPKRLSRRSLFTWWRL